jgi:hypothetical protein
MSSWKKVKNLFWQSGEPVSDTELESMSDEEFASLLADSPHAVPASGEPVEAMDVSQMQVHAVGNEVQINFQGQYDQTGIPDTDEVEKLEDFLTRLDASLPQASKVAAAEAFLGAIGKGRNDVLQDAEQKIRVVRSLLAGKEAETSNSLEGEKSAVAQLEAQIEQHRQRMERIKADLEGVRHACVVEESRLQAARVFFGSAGKPSAKGGAEG